MSSFSNSISDRSSPMGHYSEYQTYNGEGTEQTLHSRVGQRNEQVCMDTNFVNSLLRKSTSNGSIGSIDSVQSALDSLSP